MSFIEQTISKKEAKRHQKFLKKLTDRFFQFLDRVPKPERDDIRNEFIAAESEWRTYCLKHKLGTQIAEMFNAKVSYEWERKYVSQNPQ